MSAPQAIVAATVLLVGLVLTLRALDAWTRRRRVRRAIDRIRAASGVETSELRRIADVVPGDVIVWAGDRLLVMNKQPAQGSGVTMTVRRAGAAPRDVLFHRHALLTVDTSLIKELP